MGLEFPFYEFEIFKTNFFCLIFLLGLQEFKLLSFCYILQFIFCLRNQFSILVLNNGCLFFRFRFCNSVIWFETVFTKKMSRQLILFETILNVFTNYYLSMVYSQVQIFLAPVFQLLYIYQDLPSNFAGIRFFTVWRFFRIHRRR